MKIIKTGGAGYPRQFTVWRGAILHSIVNATMIAQNPGYARYLYWDNYNYVMNSMDGLYGTVAFENPEGSLVAVFFDAHSMYNPISHHYVYELDKFFCGMPAGVRTVLKDRALRYNRQFFQGEVTPLVTAAYWDDGEFLTAAYPWDAVMANGACIMSIELMDCELALDELRDAYQMSQGQVDFARSVFERKMDQRRERFELARSEIDWLVSTSSHPNAMEDCRRAFAAIGIQIE